MKIIISFLFYTIVCFISLWVAGFIIGVGYDPISFSGAGYFLIAAVISTTMGVALSIIDNKFWRQEKVFQKIKIILLVLILLSVFAAALISNFS